MASEDERGALGIARLERKVRALEGAISKLRDAKHAETLLKIIHGPGWTTVAEHELVHAHADNFHNQVDALHRAFDELVTIAKKIGNK